MTCDIGKTCYAAVNSYRRKTVDIHEVNYMNVFYDQMFKITNKDKLHVR